MTRKYGYLCAVLGFLTAFGACGDGTPQEVTTFRIGPDGRPVKGTEKQEVVVDRQAVITLGVGYTWNCAGDYTIFGGELKAFYYAGANAGNGACLGFGAGANNVMAISLPEYNWPGTSSSLGADVGSYHVKLPDSSGTHHGRNCWFRNAQGGGGTPNHQRNGTITEAACLEWCPGCAWWADLSLTPSEAPSSVYVSRFCGPGETSC
jgi:hypothetical protein